MMTNRYKKGFLLLTAPVWILVLCFIASCGKSTNITGANTQLQIINLSSDLGPVNLYINSVKQSLTTYTYTNNSGYFFLNSLTPPIQFRTANAAAANIPYQIDTVLRSNSKYTLFITGYAKDTTIKNSVLSLDTATLPAIGRAKVRFANFSPSSPDLDIKANDTLMVFEPKKLGRKFNTISPYLSLPTGNYNFTINAHNTPTKVEITLKSVTIQDGRAYTIYTQGIVGRTDSVAFGAAVLTNNLLIKATQ
ncbi:DUF4397 domain-containing protein [Mucilaginibacter flavus]|uniref:DUF4397 domain-containing protein n=1 Tax=Mucilaginibacter flavus TaxID=931504 RepID=UPI0025B2CFC9|nr:DUF4397 domain-containing protein [Mucilaginibacter flavus]MDN3583697.1 DUF4397 domain-containing protein [Mucilaginibacter flavus]